MASYFVAGVGRALLFKGEELFADARTLADSSITIGITAEDIRGGEGNALFGRYFHDSSFSMKLTDIMFNLEYIAANVGSDVAIGGNIFAYETLTADNTGKLLLGAAPVPVVSNGTPYVYFRKSSENVDMQKAAAPEQELSGFEPNTEYCVMYRKAVDGEMVTIGSQFIPDTLHAVLTVALYAGDSCNVDSATKAGEVVIDIPRFQLSGAQDLSMTATGASQTSLEGNALASGCTGCDGKAIYATITKYLAAGNWYDEAQGLVIEDLSGLRVNDERPLAVYAYYLDKAPKRLALDELNISADGTVITYTSGTGTVVAASAGTGFLSVSARDKADLETSKHIVVTA